MYVTQPPTGQCIDNEDPESYGPRRSDVTPVLTKTKLGS